MLKENEQILFSELLIIIWNVLPEEVNKKKTHQLTFNIITEQLNNEGWLIELIFQFAASKILGGASFCNILQTTRISLHKGKS